MTLSEARQILGLGPDEDPRPHLADFQAARDRIAELVRVAPNAVIARRYQQGLDDFDAALEAMNEHLKALGLAPGPEDAVPAEPAPPHPEGEDATPTGLPPGKEAASASKGSRFAARALVCVQLGLVCWAAFGWARFRAAEAVEFQRQTRLAALEALGLSHIENRRWQDASAVFSEIDAVLPGSELARAARARIAAGIGEEETQFIAYWTGQALAELEAKRLNEAEAAIRKVIERFPAEEEAPKLLAKIDEARASLARGEAVSAARRLLEERRWDEAIHAARALLDKTPNDGEARELVNEATAARDRFLADEARAVELLNQAKARDHGEFDQQALDWLREAAALAPSHPEITAQLEKMASYTRTLRVPGDFATPAEALAAARDRDRILLAGGVWQGPLVVNAAVELQGAGLEKTLLVCAPDAGSALTIGPDARGARISGIAFRHEEFRPEGSDRFSAVLVRGGAATFSDCAFVNASGHGLAVIEGGEAFALRCRFADNSWNGASAIGRGSNLEIRDSLARDNFGHGIESWDQASVTLANNACEANARNGIHCDNGPAQAVLEGNQLSDNREFGIVITSAASGRVTGNTCRGNLLGGMVVRKAAAALTVSGNQATRNQGPGLVLEKGLASEGYLANSLEKNTGSDLLPGADLTAE